MGTNIYSHPYDQCPLHHPIFYRQTSLQFEEANSYAQRSRNQAIVKSTTKFQADHFPCSFLKIGPFEVVARNIGDLVAKCYYSRRKLIWKILCNGLKSKVEFSWQDILAMRAIFQENASGILELELNQPPKFFQENNSKPLQKTHRESTLDFTEGYASQYRIHHVYFPPGSLEKFYNNRLIRDNIFFQLSQRPFPSLASPDCNLNPHFPYHQHHHLGSGSQSLNQIASQTSGLETNNFGRNLNMDEIILCMPSEPMPIQVTCQAPSTSHSCVLNEPMPIHTTSQIPSTSQTTAMEDEFACLDSLSDEEFAKFLETHLLPRCDLDL